MTVAYDRDIMEGVSVAGDGAVDIRTYGSYHGEDVYREFTIDELRVIATRAEAHRAAYQAFIDRDYEDEDKYHSDYKLLAEL